MKSGKKKIAVLVGVFSFFLATSNCRDLSGILKDETSPTLDSSSIAGSSSASDRITLTWNAASDNKAAASEINYELCISQTANGCANFAVTATTSPGATQYTFTGLAEATIYYIRIRPRDNAGNVGSASADIQVITALVPAGAPVFGIAPGSYNASQSVTITSSTSGAIICYTVDLATPACNATPTCTTGTQIANGNTVSVGSNLTLKAIACKLNKLDTAVISGNYVIDSTPPTIPGSPTATPISISQIDLSWTASTDAQTAQANIVYEICQTTTSTACNGGGFTATYTTAPGVTAYSVNSGLATLTTYYFVVRAKDGLANVNPTAQINATTLAAGTVSTPTFSPVAGTYGSTQNATPSTSTGGAIVCYKTGSAPGACTAGPTCAVGSTQFSTAVAIASTSTLYAVGCKTGYIDSTTGSAVYTIDTAAPTTPGSFTATAASSSQINLSWTASSDDTTATGSIVYEICKTTTPGGCGTFSATFTTAGGATSYNDTGLNPLTNYYYVIRARDSFSKFGTASSEITGTTQSLGTVNAPTFSPVAGTYGATQNVTPSTSTSGAIVCYKMGSAPGACTAGPTCAAGATQFSSAVSVASTGTMYAVGCKTSYADSSAASAVYTIDTAAPTTPGSFTATAVSSSQINLIWAASTDDTTAAGSIVYEICRSTSSGGCGTFTATITTSAGATSYNDTGLTPLTSYYYVIRARDSFSKYSAASTEQTATTTSDISFATTVNLAVGSGPREVALGDIDGDGKLDAVIAVYGASTATVLRNTSTSGTVSFAAAVNSTVGTNPHGIAIGDIDGDGKKDIVSANYTATSISVLRNTSTSGSVSLASKVDFAVGTNPGAVAIVDIDGDAKLDVVVVNTGASTVSVLLNTSTSGSISFATKVDFAVTGGPNRIAAGDIDGDGKLDVLTAGNALDKVSILRNLSTIGTASFAATVDFSAPDPFRVTTADVDGDGKLDVIAANVSPPSVSVFRNTSTSGTISLATRVDFAVASICFDVTTGDISGDGKSEIIAANDSASSVSILRNTSTVGSITGSSFATKVDFTVGAGPFSVVSGDIDGDGKLDIVTENYWGNNISVLRNTR